MSTASGVYKKWWTLAELAEHVGGQPSGDLSKSVTHVAGLKDASEDAISLCSNPRHQQFLESTKAGIVILSHQFIPEYHGARILVDNPRVAFAKVVELLHPSQSIDPGVDETAVVDPSSPVPDCAQVQAHVVIGKNVVLGKRVFLGSGTVIGDSASIGANTRIAPNATIFRNTVIGKSCKISSGVVIGAPGHSYEWDDEKWVAIPNIGNVVVGDDVDIGAGTSIDRGSISMTRIGNGVKIDNNVQIAHNVEIGDHCMIVGNVGIAGSAKIGKRCILGGQAGVIDNVRITDDVVVHAFSLVSKSILNPGTYSGMIPAREAIAWKRILAKLIKIANADNSELRKESELDKSPSIRKVE